MYMQCIKNKKYNILLKISKLSFIFILLFAIAIPNYFVKATDETDTDGVTISTTIENPLKDGLDDIPSFIVAIIKIVLVVGVPLVALAIIYSGFLFVQAQGNKDKLETAKKAILYSIIGAALVLGAFVISNAIQGTVDDISSTTN